MIISNKMIYKYLPTGPFASQMYAQTGHYRWFVLNAHRSQVETVCGQKVGCLRKIFACCVFIVFIMS